MSLKFVWNGQKSKEEKRKKKRIRVNFFSAIVVTAKVGLILKYKSSLGDEKH